MLNRRSISVAFQDASLQIATVTDRSWWRRARVYTVALYGDCLWVRDDGNRPVTDSEVIEVLDAGRATAMEIQRRRL